MDKEKILKCIELADAKFKFYYEEAKIQAVIGPQIEREYARAALALKELKDDLWQLYQQVETKPPQP